MLRLWTGCCGSQRSCHIEGDSRWSEDIVCADTAQAGGPQPGPQPGPSEPTREMCHDAGSRSGSIPASPDQIAMARSPGEVPAALPVPPAPALAPAPAPSALASSIFTSCNALASMYTEDPSQIHTRSSAAVRALSDRRRPCDAAAPQHPPLSVSRSSMSVVLDDSDGASAASHIAAPTTLCPAASARDTSQHSDQLLGKLGSAGGSAGGGGGGSSSTSPYPYFPSSVASAAVPHAGRTLRQRLCGGGGPPMLPAPGCAATSRPGGTRSTAAAASSGMSQTAPAATLAAPQLVPVDLLSASLPCHDSVECGTRVPGRGANEGVGVRASSVAGTAVCGPHSLTHASAASAQPGGTAGGGRTQRQSSTLGTASVVDLDVSTTITITPVRTSPSGGHLFASPLDSSYPTSPYTILDLAAAPMPTPTHAVAVHASALGLANTHDAKNTHDGTALPPPGGYGYPTAPGMGLGAASPPEHQQHQHQHHQHQYQHHRHVAPPDHLQHRHHHHGARASMDLGFIRATSLTELGAQLEALKWLASGSSGRVYTALWKGSPVAVKLVLSTTPDQLRESAREALLSRVVSHPCVTQCYTVCSEVVTPDHLRLPESSHAARGSPAMSYLTQHDHNHSHSHHHHHHNNNSNNNNNNSNNNHSNNAASSSIFAGVPGMPTGGSMRRSLSVGIRIGPISSASSRVTPRSLNASGGVAGGGAVASGSAGRAGGVAVRPRALHAPVGSIIATQDTISSGDALVTTATEAVAGSSGGFAVAAVSSGAFAGCGGGGVGSGLAFSGGVTSSVPSPWATGSGGQRCRSASATRSVVLGSGRVSPSHYSHYSSCRSGEGPEVAVEAARAALAVAGLTGPESSVTLVTVAEAAVAAGAAEAMEAKAAEAGHGSVVHTSEQLVAIRAPPPIVLLDGDEGAEEPSTPPMPTSVPGSLPGSHRTSMTGGARSSRSPHAFELALDDHQAATAAGQAQHRQQHQYQAGRQSEQLGARDDCDGGGGGVGDGAEGGDENERRHKRRQQPQQQQRMLHRPSLSPSLAGFARSSLGPVSGAANSYACVAMPPATTSDSHYGSFVGLTGVLSPAGAGRFGGGNDLNTTLSLSELLRTGVQGDDDSSLVAQSLPAVLLSMGAAPGRYCTVVVLEWCNQGTLLQSIRSRPFNPERSPDNTEGLLALLRTALEVAQGMRYLHSLDIIHGDLKPSNVLLQSHHGAPDVAGIWAADIRGYVAKVADFGLAVPAHNSSVGAAVGTSAGRGGSASQWGALAYLAPEVPECGPSKKSDIYSFGCLLYHMCTGRQPFQGIRQGRLLVGLATGALRLEWPDHVYKLLRRLGEACLSADPRARPSFDKVVTALQKIIRHVGSTHSQHGGVVSSRTTNDASPGASYVSDPPTLAAVPGAGSSEGPAHAGRMSREISGLGAADAASVAQAWRSALAGCAQLGGAGMFVAGASAGPPPQ